MRDLANPGTRSIRCRTTLLSGALVYMAWPATGFGAQSDTPPPTPPPPPPGLLTRLFPLTETADSLSVSYYVSAQARNDINVEALDLSRAWRFGSLLELQGRLGAFHSQGARVDATYLGDQDSTTSGATAGVGGRLYSLAIRRMRLFVEGSVEVLYTPGGNEFPAGGTGINALLRAGGGVQCQITRRLALEAHFEYTHISNGGGDVIQNPMWNGRGGGLSIRRSL